jgi:uncharacterized membrane protein
MVSQRIAWPLWILAASAFVDVSLFAGLPPVVRLVAAACFLPICPGMALVRLLRIADPVAEMAVAAALSIALEIVVALFMVYARVWSVGTGLSALIMLCVIGAVAQVIFYRPVDREPMPDDQ